MKIRYFEGYDNYEANGDYNVIDIVKREKYISADMLTDCKSFKTVIRRFFKGLNNIKEFEGWEECIKESCESGCFTEKSFYKDEKGIKVCDYAYEVEQQDETLWYITLTIPINK